MWRKALIVIILVSSSFCLRKNAIKFSIEYFSYREIKFVCLLTCEVNNYWSYNFAKSASLKSIAVSSVEVTENMTNPNSLRMCLDQRFTSVGVLIDSKCDGFEKIMTYASKNKLFDAMHKWLILEDIDDNPPEVVLNINTEIIFKNFTVFQNCTEINTDITQAFHISKSLSVVSSLNTSVDSDIIIGSDKEEFDYDLQQVFNFGKIQGGNLTVERVGFWNDEFGLIMLKNLNSYKYYDRWDFQQWAMRMIVVYIDPPEIIEPEMIIGRVVPPGVAHITQTSAMVLHVVSELHNFRYTYTAADRWIGPYKPDNTMVVVSALYYEYQDISPLVRINSVVWGTIDVVHPPLTNLETKYFYRIPTFGPGKFENQFLRPLTSGSWLCMMAVVALCALALVMSATVEQRPMSAQYALFSVIASVCQQFFEDACDTKRISQARRITMFVTGLSCVLIYNYYTSSVVSWLLSGPPPSINSLEELLESPLELIYEDIGYTRSWLQTPTYYFNKKNAKVEDDMRQKVFNKKKGEPLLIPPDEGIEMVKAGGYAYHTEVSTANNLISRKFNQMELCELGSLQSMDKTALHAPIQKNSPYKEFFVWSLARLSERGIISCIQGRTRSDSVSCEGSSPRALALGGAAPAFLLLLFGYLLATGIMLFERFVFMNTQRN